MSEMKTVTINGVTYSVHDPDAFSGTDKSLSIENLPADAAAVGAAINGITPEKIGAPTTEYAEAFAKSCYNPNGAYVAISDISQLDSLVGSMVYRLASDPQIHVNGYRIDMISCLPSASHSSYLQFGWSYDGKLQARACWYGTWYPWRVLGA